jgi:putative transposase
MRKVKRSHPFEITATVVLPDHLHAIWTLPDGDRDYPVRWSLIKAGFSRALDKTECINASRQHKRERGIWQRRYWEHLIRDDNDFAAHMDYIHINPVKHGLVTRVRDWPYSTFHRLVLDGVYAENWAGDIGNDTLPYDD